MDRWLSQLREELLHLEEGCLLRCLRPIETQGRLILCGGQTLVNLASNDYLALANHPHLKAAATQAIQQYGTGSGASRLVTGHLPFHAQAEARFTQFKHAQAALIFPTGYMANLGVITALAAKGDLVCVDKLNHASLLDAARASAADVRVYPHRQTAKLARLLQRHSSHSANTSPSHRPTRRFIVTDSVFSMDGDTADLPELCDLADRYDAILIVDEAHATGVLGPSGAGLCELQGVSQRVDVVISTASKALGGLGGIVTAPSEVIDTLINRARSFIYTTAIPPAQAAAITAALDVVRDEPWRRQRVLQLAKRLQTSLQDMSRFDRSHYGDDRVVTPIIPIVTGTPQAAMSLADHLQNHGFFAPAIRPPTVPRGTARVRISLRADLEDNDITRLQKALSAWEGNMS